MKNIFFLFLVLIFGQHALCYRFKTFEAMRREQEKIRKEIPALINLSEKLASSYNSHRVSNILEHLTSEIQSTNISEECNNAMIYALSHFNQWSKNMLDATAKPPAAIQYGAINWAGGFDQCMDNQPPVGYNSTKPLKSHYCRTIFGKKEGLIDLTPKLNIGLCVPDSCTSNDIHAAMDLIADVIAEFSPNSTVPGHIKESTVTCYKKQKDLKFSNAAIVMIVIAVIFGALVLCGSAYDLLVVKRVLEPFKKYTYPINANGLDQNGLDGSMSSIPDADANGNDVNYETVQEEETKQLTPPQPQYAPPLRMWEKFLVAFSAYSNSLKILDAKQQPNRLNCLDGIRFLSMSWVILGHSYFFAVPIVNNLASFFPILTKTWTYQAIVNATFSVDSFFVLSGLLTAYLFLKETDKMGTINNRNFWLKYYFHRYWRLTPPYMLFLGFYTALFKYVGNGPFWNQEYGLDSQACDINWWSNLLYVNNIVHSKNMCMGWTWYLANDMQFHYIVAPLILIPLFFALRYPQRKYFTVISAVVVFVILLIPTMYIGIYTSEQGLAPETTAKAFDTIYIKPWARADAYVIGLLTGALILEHQKRRWKLHPAIVCVGWVAATGMCLAVIYGLSGSSAGAYVMSVSVNALYGALSRLTWSIGLSWLIYACLTGNGGWINRLLSWPAFIPLSRLTYCAYLVHPVVIIFVYLGSQAPAVVDTVTVVYWYFGHMVAAYSVAFILSVVWESPIIGLERIMLKRE